MEFTQLHPNGLTTSKSEINENGETALALLDLFITQTRVRVREAPRMLLQEGFSEKVTANQRVAAFIPFSEARRGRLAVYGLRRCSRNTQCSASRNTESSPASPSPEGKVRALSSNATRALCAPAHAATAAHAYATRLKGASSLLAWNTYTRAL